MTSCLANPRGRDRAEIRSALLAAVSAAARLPSEPPQTDGTAVWRSIASGQWSVVDRFEHEEHRYVVARRNPASAPAGGLSRREIEVLRLAARGNTNKFIAYELRLATSTIAMHLSSGMRKLGFASRLELVSLLVRGL